MVCVATGGARRLWHLADPFEIVQLICECPHPFGTAGVAGMSLNGCL